MEEWEIEEMLRNLRSRRNINTSHIHSREYESTWSKFWNGAKKVYRYVVPVITEIFQAVTEIKDNSSCLLM